MCKYCDLLVLCLRSGPRKKKVKKEDFKAEKKPKLSKEELKKNGQQRKKELKKSRQQAERKEMFEIICRSKQVWGDLRKYVHVYVSVFLWRPTCNIMLKPHTKFKCYLRGLHCC